MRTFTRATLDEANAAWADGEFSDEWKPYRHQAAMNGLVYPPSGSKWDAWDDDAPSQRAMLVRAIREAPKLLTTCIIGANSWETVIGRLLKARDDWRQRNAESARDEDWARDDADHQQAVMALGTILRRIDDSR